MIQVLDNLIEVDKRNVAWIAGTRVKVREIVTDRWVHGSSPEELHFQYPHLSMAQIHSALSYYFQHQDEIDAEIEKSLKESEILAARNSESPLQKKLRGLRSVNGR